MQPPAEEAYLAFAETFLRSPGVPYVHQSYVAERSLALLEVRRDLRLVGLHGPGLARLGATAAGVSGPYDLTRIWARALHAHPDTPDGMLYRARHDDDAFAIALFDRAAEAIWELERRDLLAPDQRTELATWLDRYGIGLL